MDSDTEALPDVFTLTCDDAKRAPYTSVFCDHRYCTNPAADLETFIKSADIQEAYKLCILGDSFLSYGEIEAAFVSFADKTCARLTTITLPISPLVKASTHMCGQAILPVTLGGLAPYVQPELRDYEEEDVDGDSRMAEKPHDGGTRSVSAQNLNAQQAKRVSNHIRFNDDNPDKHGAFADTEKSAPAKSAEPVFKGNMLQNLILRSNVDRKEAMAMDRLVAKLPTSKLLDAEWDQLQDFVGTHAASNSQGLEIDGVCPQRREPFSCACNEFGEMSIPLWQEAFKDARRT
ncbi:hypothetical protein ABBQ38_013242 [Trebouxia sp. C0009 RCD-2024]